MRPVGVIECVWVKTETIGMAQMQKAGNLEVEATLVQLVKDGGEVVMQRKSSIRTRS